jgi:hypothetical protein
VALAAVAGVAAVLALSSLAWACTTFSTLTLSSSSGSAQTEVVVRGEGAAVNAPVVVRWDSRAGVKLAEARVDAAGNFSVPVRIPDAEQGVHVLLATDSKGEVARQAFEVAGPGGKLAAPAPAFHRDRAIAQTDYARLGLNVLALGLLAVVPVLGALVLLRRPIAVRVPSASES